MDFKKAHDSLIKTLAEAITASAELQEHQNEIKKAESKRQDLQHLIPKIAVASWHDDADIKDAERKLKLSLRKTDILVEALRKASDKIELNFDKKVNRYIDNRTALSEKGVGLIDTSMSIPNLFSADINKVKEIVSEIKESTNFQIHVVETNNSASEIVVLGCVKGMQAVSGAIQSSVENGEIKQRPSTIFTHWLPKFTKAEKDLDPATLSPDNLPYSLNRVDISKAEFAQAVNVSMDTLGSINFCSPAMGKQEIREIIRFSPRLTTGSEIGINGVKLRDKSIVENAKSFFTKEPGLTPSQ
ncbi:hypothetical protein [Ferrimonas marina]|uniref:Uncharacterized protein n=1 Tax=Ferrimonas marina TaxID=299255 RepID=A0A1M5T5P2_9GAMM|nr:hypothetical protein [Ferrimonas marina]SHH46016.1 hypothetical protein SAMN02745129_2010 [Ferrimonas marina]